MQCNYNNTKLYYYIDYRAEVALSQGPPSIGWSYLQQTHNNIFHQVPVLSCLNSHNHQSLSVIRWQLYLHSQSQMILCIHHLSYSQNCNQYHANSVCTLPASGCDITMSWHWVLLLSTNLSESSIDGCIDWGTGIDSVDVGPSWSSEVVILYIIIIEKLIHTLKD